MPNWTAEQQRAIDANGNLLVSAGAGSGKTAVAAEKRILIRMSFICRPYPEPLLLPSSA